MTRLEYLKEQKRFMEDKLNANVQQMRKHECEIEILKEFICEEEKKINPQIKKALTPASN